MSASVAKPSAASGETVWHPRGTWQRREDSSIDPQKERISELKPIVINSIQSIQFPSNSTFAKPHTRAELKRPTTKNRSALGERWACGVGTDEQKQAPRDARRGYRRRRPAFSLVRSDRRRLGRSNLGRGRRDRFGGALPGRLRGEQHHAFSFQNRHRVRHHGGPEARVHRGQGTRI